METVNEDIAVGLAAPVLVSGWLLAMVLQVGDDAGGLYTLLPSGKHEALMMTAEVCRIIPFVVQSECNVLFCFLL